MKLAHQPDVGACPLPSRQPTELRLPSRARPSALERSSARPHGPERRLSAWASALAASLAAVGCASAAPPPADEQKPAAASDAVPWPHVRLLPLRDRFNYRYTLETDQGTEPWLARVHRQSATEGTIQFPNGARQFEYRADGIRLLRKPVPVYVLRTPISVGNRWPGVDGSRVEIVEVDASVTVPAGRFVGCVRTLEQRGGDRPLRIATTFCPDVGIVVLEAASGAATERAVLDTFGPPVEIGPGGELRPVE